MENASLRAEHSSISTATQASHTNSILALLLPLPMTIQKDLAPIGVILLLSIASEASTFNQFGVFMPKQSALGLEPLFPSGNTALPLSLSAAEPCATLDYGFVVAGLPEFSVTAVDGAFAEVEVKYAESFTSLSNVFSDGPFTWASALSNSNRVETFNFTSTGITASLTQGGQRWQSLCLLHGDGITFDAVRFRATVPVVEDVSTDLAGTFVSSDEKLNAIWKLGPRAVSVACIGAHSQPPIWSVDAENGTYVPGTCPGYSYKATNLSNYVLDFDTYLLRGGVTVSISYEMPGNYDGVLIHLASEYPAENTFSNANKTLFPPNTVKLAYGHDFVNITTVTSYTLGTFNVPFAVKENEWHHVTLDVNSDAHQLAYWLNGTLVFNVTLKDLPNAGFIGDFTMSGAIGFGGWQDQGAYIRNVVATDRLSGDIIYSNAMTNETDVLPDFGEQSNAYAVCMDGGKRDRYLWFGDFYHAVRVLGVAQGAHDRNVITGTWRYMFDAQTSAGQFQPFVPISYEAPMPLASFYTINAFPDYAILGLISFVYYMEYSNDIGFATEHWTKFKRAVNWMNTYKVSNGLLDFAGDYKVFIGPTKGVGVNSAAVQAYRGMSRVAIAVGDSESAAHWTSLADDLSASINSLLWSDALGVYIDEVSTPEKYSVSGVAFAITSGVANKSQALSSIKLVDATLRDPAGIGYLDSTAVDKSTKISPNTNGFLLDALLRNAQTEPAKYLLDNLWGAMLNESYASGGSWEYIGQDRTPGLSDYTSLAHPWGGAATYVLTNFVAGIKPESFGFQTWSIKPLLLGFGVSDVYSRVPTPFGQLDVQLQLDGSKSELSVVITSPAGTRGIFAIEIPSNDSVYMLNITGGTDAAFTVSW